MPGRSWQPGRELRKMLSVEEALEKVLEKVQILEAEEKPLLESLGQVLAEDIYSDLDVPPLDNAAMDGFAVQAASTKGASESSPRVLRVIGEVAAGASSMPEVAAGTAARIMTGAPLPPGADAVVPFEETDEMQRKAARGSISGEIAILKEAAPGANVRPAGEDITKGALVLEKGRLLRPPELGVLASLGRARVKVIRRPVVSVLATGDELQDVGEPPSLSKIYNSNSYSIAASVLRYGGIPKVLGIARDTFEDLEGRIRRALESDMLVTSGGVSLGDYDVVKDVLAKSGEITFWAVRMKPGKPLAFGTFQVKEKGKVRRVPHLGLPGYPVSAMVAFELFVRPSILKMMGRKNLTKPRVRAIMEERVENKGGRRFFARAVVTRHEDKYYARLSGIQASGALTSLAQANALVVIPEDTVRVEAGEEVEAMMLDWSEEQG